MLPRTSSIWQHDSQPNASGKPGAVQLNGRISTSASSQRSLKCTFPHTLGKWEWFPNFAAVGMRLILESAGFFLTELSF